MALIAVHKDITFGVGDRIKVFQKLKEGDKARLQAFEGMVIGIKGREENKSFTVRRIGAQQIGIERIFPLVSPSIEKIEVVKKGTEGVRHAKLYYTRDKSHREVEKIYSRTSNK
jgi:large subunit ribosomal protein L19